MGGAEISAVNLGEEFIKQGHDVTYYLQRTVPFNSGKLHVRLHGQIKEKHDYFICVRPHIVLDPNRIFELSSKERVKNLLKHKKKILWSGDAYDQNSNLIFDDNETAQSMDAFVFKTEWQREKILDRFHLINPSKAQVIYNGVRSEYFDLTEEPQENRFIHTSTWYRGLANFIQIWPKILKQLPDAEIHVFSKTSLYSDLDNKQQGYAKIVEELVKLPGMVLREPVPQWILAKELRKAWLMLYPNTGFVESSCGSALQSQAAGTPVVATARAGLVETIGNNGVMVYTNVDNWQDKFVEGVVELCQNKKRRNELSEKGCSQAKQQSWTQQASLWLDFLKSL